MSTKGIEMPNELELYPHNEKAYRKLLDMLSETRRACIIHPTGTGKAFIAYRYAFDHPKKRILWMSPSTYIEQEQEASIRRELPNYEFKNIERMTYQTAMHRAQKGNLDIHADTVIFDEFLLISSSSRMREVDGKAVSPAPANELRYPYSAFASMDRPFDLITSCGESPYPWESSASSCKRLRSSISVAFPCISIIPFLFKIHRFVVIVDQAGDQNLLGFCGRYGLVGKRVLCDPAAGRDRILDLDESERFELVSISIESRLADTELPDHLIGRRRYTIIE